MWFYIPDKNDPLCKEVSIVLQTPIAGKRKPYLKVSLEKKAIIGKYVAENGIVSA